MNSHFSKAPKVTKDAKVGGEVHSKGARQVAMLPSKTLRVESPLSTELEKLVYNLIGIGMQVHSALGPGLRERVYEDAYIIGLEDANLSYQRQVSFDIKYNGRSVSPIRVDLLVENQVIVELKSVTQLHDVHSAQLLTYLKLTELPVGIILNFNVQHLKDGIRRHIRTRPRT